MRLDDLLECAAGVEGLRHCSRKSISEGEIVVSCFVWLRRFVFGFTEWIGCICDCLVLESRVDVTSMGPCAGIFNTSARENMLPLKV